MAQNSDLGVIRFQFLCVIAPETLQSLFCVSMKDVRHSKPGFRDKEVWKHNVNKHGISVLLFFPEIKYFKIYKHGFDLIVSILHDPWIKQLHGLLWNESILLLLECPRQARLISVIFPLMIGKILCWASITSGKKMFSFSLFQLYFKKLLDMSKRETDRRGNIRFLNYC